MRQIIRMLGRYVWQYIGMRLSQFSMLFSRTPLGVQSEYEYFKPKTAVIKYAWEKCNGPLTKRNRQSYSWVWLCGVLYTCLCLVYATRVCLPMVRSPKKSKQMSERSLICERDSRRPKLWHARGTAEKENLASDRTVADFKWSERMCRWAER